MVGTAPKQVVLPQPLVGLTHHSDSALCLLASLSELGSSPAEQRMAPTQPLSENVLVNLLSSFLSWWKSWGFSSKTDLSTSVPDLSPWSSAWINIASFCNIFFLFFTDFLVPSPLSTDGLDFPWFHCFSLFWCILFTLPSVLTCWSVLVSSTSSPPSPSQGPFPS